MLNNFLTEKTFRQGLTTYLDDKKYGNAEKDELWGYLTRQAHKDKVLSPHITVKQIMDTWTMQMGYPQLSVTMDYGNGLVILDQVGILSITIFQ